MTEISGIIAGIIVGLLFFISFILYYIYKLMDKWETRFLLAKALENQGE